MVQKQFAIATRMRLRAQSTLARTEQSGLKSVVLYSALDALREEGLNVIGPHPADTLFHEDARKTHDTVVGMYHDQVLIPGD